MLQCIGKKKIYILVWDRASERPLGIKHNNYKAQKLKTIDKIVILNVYKHIYSCI